MYVKRFLEGVAGVLDAPLVAGGVRARTDSRAPEPRVVSDDGVAWGISLWKSSDRRSVEKVRFASSAVEDKKISISSNFEQPKLTEHTFLEMKLAMRGPFLWFCGR